MKKSLIYIIIIVLSLFTGIVSAQQLVEGILAVVGKEIILKSEVDNLVQSYAIQNKIDLQRDTQKLQQLYQQVFNRLIEQKLLLVKAEQDTITVDDREIDQRVEQHIKYLIEQVGSEQKLEQAFKSPINKIKKDLRKETADRLKVDIVRRNKFMNVKVSRREVENFYNIYRDSIPDVKETVNISHILKHVKPSEESKREAFEKIRAIRQEIEMGENFAELAQKYSEDPASAKRGGDLGFTKRGDFVREYEEAAFALEEGEVSDIVESQFGYHIIKLIERRGEKIRTSHILVQVQPTTADDRRVIEQLNNIRNQLNNGASFEELAQQHSDDDNVEDDKGNLGVFEVENMSIPQFARVVSQLDVMDISEPFKTEYGYHIVKLNSRQEKRKLSLESDWDRVQEIALNFKIEREYAKWIEGLKQEIPVEVKIN